METKKYRVFLDSNVILSGLFSERGAPRLILDLLSLDLPVLTGVTGRFNLTEIERTLEKKMAETLPVYRLYLPKLKLDIIPLPSREDLRPFVGAAEDKDLPVLAAVVNGKADHFVTGDKKLISLIRRKGDFPVKTVSPAEFLDKVLPEILGAKHRG
ncbi:MAG: putative toxin-antitoxin system toxin component, PIN family [Candidatus Aminicenantes bacterium]|nr:putative toxin-antitoxin system toxin component, PIN family [Candidatus Aminicenantes bacterium]